MRFVYNLTVPANTLKADPQNSNIQLVKGRLNKVRVRFHRGCHNQVKIIMLEGLTQIIPVADSEPLEGDGVIYDIPMNYDLPEKAPQLILKGWSPGTDYPHVITFFIDLDPAGDESSLLQEILFGRVEVGIVET